MRYCFYLCFEKSVNFGKDEMLLEFKDVWGWNLWISCVSKKL